MKNNACSSSGIMIGALLGAVMGVAMTLYLVPKASGKLIEDMKDLYDNACEKSSEIAKGLQEKTASLIKSANLPAEEEILEYAQNNSSLLMGAVGGAVLGIAAAVFSDKKDSYEKIKETLMSEEDWPEKAKQAAQTLGKEFKSLKKKGSQSFYEGIDDLLQWVSLGLHALESK